MRALVRPLATHNVFFPIESIVFVFVLGMLAYFHILNGIKHSSFFAPTYPTAIRPAYARLNGDEWVGVSPREWKQLGDETKAVELQQFVFRLEGRKKVVPELGSKPSVLSQITQHLPEQLTGLSDEPYASACYHPASNLTSVPCFVATSSDSTSSTLTLSFLPGAREDWLAALRHVKSVTVDGLEYDLHGAKREETIGEMKSSKWVAYALRATFLRFWELTKVREPRSDPKIASFSDGLTESRLHGHHRGAARLHIDARHVPAPLAVLARAGFELLAIDGYLPFLGDGVPVHPSALPVSRHPA